MFSYDQLGHGKSGGLFGLFSEPSVVLDGAFEYLQQYFTWKYRFTYSL